MTSSVADLTLIEQYHPGITPAGLVIGLTPQSCYALDRAGVPYAVLDSVVDYRSAVALADVVDRQIQEWVDGVDRWLADSNRAPEAFMPARAYYAQLQPTIGSIALRVWELRQLFEATSPGRVVYFGHRSLDTLEDSLSYKFTPSLFSRIAPLLAAERCVEFLEVSVPTPPVAPSVRPTVASALRTRLATSPIVRDWFADWTAWRTPAITGAPLSGSNLLFLHLNAYLRVMMVQSLAAGARTYHQSDGRVVEQLRGRHRVAGPAPSAEGTAQSVDESELSAQLTKLSTVCRLDLTSVFETRFRHFVTSVVPRIRQGAREYGRVFDDMDIHGVILANRRTVGDFAAVEACRVSGRTESVFVNHGDDVFVQDWRDSLIDQFDVFADASDESAAHLRHRPLRRAVIVQQSERYRQLPRARLESADARPVLVFVPTMFAWDETCWNDALCPDTWYYGWLRELLDWLGARTDYSIVWKAFPQAGATPDPFREMIADGGWSHIRYDTRPFAQWLDNADRALVDFPSTPLYEAAAAGLAVMSVYFTPLLRVREGARRSFGRSLQPAESNAEALSRVAEFLDSDPGGFRPAMACAAPPFYQTLADHFNRNAGPELTAARRR